MLSLIHDYSTDDLSFHKNATQSSTYPGQGTINDANNAVDGNKNTCMKTNDISRNSLIKTVWWKLNLGDVYNILSINILFKNYRENVDCKYLYV